MEITTPTKTFSLNIASGAAISQAFSPVNQIGGLIIVPAAWTDANIGFKVSDAQDGTFVIACDKTGSPIQISGVTTNASKAYAIPNELFPAHHVKLWSKSTTAATTTDTNQDSARALTVILK